MDDAMSLKNLKYVGYTEVAKPENDGWRCDPVEDAVRAYREGTALAPDPMFSDMIKRGMVWVPARMQEFFGVDFAYSTITNAFLESSSMWARIHGITAPEPEPEPPPPLEPEFEVNMVEALVGWKAWTIDKGHLFSVSVSSARWLPDQPLVAHCAVRHTYPTHPKHAECPIENCSCGIYGAATRESAEEYIDQAEEFVGLVYGWGRYVRSDKGWRAQYAYPKAFYLSADQESLVAALKPFHVPIHIEQPVLAYSPEEDGYEHRNDEADWYSGACEVPVASEDSNDAKDASDTED
jgi:hypothetical protein